MTARDAWGKKSSYSGEQDNCPYMKRDLTAMQDTKNRGVVLTADMRRLVTHVKGGATSTPAS